MTKQAPKEPNELYLCWNLVKEPLYAFYGRWKVYKYLGYAILRFWTLKAKIDDYKKQIRAFTKQVNKLTTK
jgi:hypothetical protein